MVNKTKKRRNHCKKKTIKIRDVNEIITINKKFNNFSKENLTKTLQKTLVKEFKNRIMLDCSTLPYKNNKYTYSYVINKNDNYGIYYYTDNITNKKNTKCDEKIMGMHLIIFLNSLRNFSKIVHLFAFFALSHKASH